MTIFLLLWALVASVLAIASRVLLNGSDREVEWQRAAKEYWKERYRAMQEMVEARDAAIAHQHMEIERLTPKHGSGGRFVSKTAL